MIVTDYRHVMFVRVSFSSFSYFSSVLCSTLRWLLVGFWKYLICVSCILSYHIVSYFTFIHIKLIPHAKFYVVIELI